MNNIFRIIIIALLSYIAIINYNYIKVGWCTAEIAQTKGMLFDLHQKFIESEEHYE
jgi:hypothetical protein